MIASYGSGSQGVASTIFGINIWLLRGCTDIHRWLRTNQLYSLDGMQKENTMLPHITLYSSYSCEQCAMAKDFFEQRNIPFEYVIVDVLSGQERNDVMAILNKAAMKGHDRGEREELAYNYNNLMSLCKECHQNIHNKRLR